MQKKIRIAGGLPGQVLLIIFFGLFLCCAMSQAESCNALLTPTRFSQLLKEVENINDKLNTLSPNTEARQIIDLVKPLAARLPSRFLDETSTFLGWAELLERGGEVEKAAQVYTSTFRSKYFYLQRIVERERYDALKRKGVNITLGPVPFGAAPENGRFLVRSSCKRKSGFGDCWGRDAAGREYSFFRGKLSEIYIGVSNTKIQLALPLGLRFGQPVADAITSFEALCIPLKKIVNSEGTAVYASQFVVPCKGCAAYMIELTEDSDGNLSGLRGRADIDAFRSK